MSVPTSSRSKLSRRRLIQFGGVGAVGVGAAVFATLGSPFRQVSEDEASELRAAQQRFVYTADVMCPAECGLAVNVVKGVASAIYGNPHVPYNAGTMCAKGCSGVQMVYSPSRIKSPMIRVGERGEGKFKRVSWPEAVAYIADKLVAIKKEHGPESVIMDCGDVTDRDTYYRLFRAFGTPHVTEHGSICDTPRRHGPRLMFGGKRVEPDLMRPVHVRQADGTVKADYSYKTKLIVYAGWNPFTATRINYESRGTVEAQLAGAKLVVIDPAFTNTASKADKWLPIRPGTDPDLFAFMLRYLLENDSKTDPNRTYIDWSFKADSVGWDKFEAAFRGWWGKTDPVNNLKYFSAEWAAARTDLDQEDLVQLAHQFGSTKPAALIWGMAGTGHHYNGYITSILGTVLNVITGNFDEPGGVIDTELTKSDKGGSANGKDFLERPIQRTVDGKVVEATQEDLHMDYFGDWPAGWDDVVGDYPRRFTDGVTLKHGPLKGHKYPIKAYLLRTGNSVITGSATWKWKEALTAKDADGKYNTDLVVYIDTPFLESGLYADVILPEASYLERMSLADIYPSHPIMYLRDFVIEKLHESKTPFDIMQLFAAALAERDPTFPLSEFTKYKVEEDFWNEALAAVPGRPNVGSPMPYPNLPKGYKLLGTPDSLDAGRVVIDHEKKEVKGEPVTAQWLRDHNGVAVWPMSWQRYKGGGNLKTASKKIEFVWDFMGEMDGASARLGQYAKYNELIEESGEVPVGIAELGWTKYPDTFFWFETKWNPHTNSDYASYKEDYPFQLIGGRIHHSMSGTQSAQWLGRIAAEDLWVPLGEAISYEPVVVDEKGISGSGRKVGVRAGGTSVGVIQMAISDGKRLGLTTGDLVVLETPLGKEQNGRVNLCETIRPGVLRVAFAAGGRFAPAAGQLAQFQKTTVDHNELVDPEVMSPIMGQPSYNDMLVRVRKA